MSAVPPLDFALIGGPRAGCGWLAAALRAHPGTVMPQAPRLGAAAPALLGGSRRRSLAAIHDAQGDDAGPVGREALRGDVAPHLLADAEAAHRLKTFAPGLKPVVLLRHPLDMLVSLYLHERRRRPAAASFAAEIERRPELLDLARYHRHLVPWFDAFGPDRLHIDTFEAFFADERRGLPGLFRHLGLDDRFRPPVLGRKVNPADPRPPGAWRRWRNRAASLVTRPGLVPAAAGRDVVRRKRFSLARPADLIAPDTRLAIMDRLEPELRRLEGLLGHDLNGWREASPPAVAANVVWLDLHPRQPPRRLTNEA